MSRVREEFIVRMEYKNLQQVITLLLSLSRKRKFARFQQKIREIRSSKRYNKEQFCKDVADIPWSTVESFDDINDAALAWNSLFVDVANWHAPIN